MQMQTPPRLPIRPRNDLHLARKVWHCGMGVFIAAVYALGLGKGASIGILLVALIAFIALESLRLMVPELNAILIKLWGPLMRKSEIRRMSGTPFYIASVLLVIMIFSKMIAILSILFLAIGDPVSSLVGILYGDRGPRFKNGKSLLGTLAGVVTCFLISVVGLWPADLPWSAWMWISAVGGLAGGLAEWVPLDIDDNFSIPILSALSLWVALSLWTS